jgi:hypothetical protein
MNTLPLSAFYLENAPDDWDGTSVRINRPGNWKASRLALVRILVLVTLQCFGPPNDEAFSRSSAGVNSWLDNLTVVPFVI